jgi:all-trans-retinol 13,14-reductase
MDKEVVIIGSGLAGLTSALVLARRGLPVIVLEKSKQMGGCLQTFYRKGVKFETGMHYIGSMHEGEILYRMFDFLDIRGDVVLSRLDASACDIISILDDRYQIPNGEEEFTDAMLKLFPAEREGLKNYWAMVNEVARTSPVSVYMDKGYFPLLKEEFINQSASGFIDRNISDVRLRQILAGNAPLYAGVRDRTNLYTHAVVRALYKDNAYRIAGGSDSIALSLAKSIETCGGVIRTSAEVERINVEADRAISVSLKTGEKIHASHFISTAHPARTLEMLDTPLIRKAWRERIYNITNTVSNFTLYLKFKPDTMPYLNSNFFRFNSGEIWEMPLKCAQASFPQQWLYMHLCSAPEQAYAQGAVVISYMDYGEVEAWHGSKPSRRGDDYEEFKRKKAELLLDDLERHFPGVRNAVEDYYTSSPLTYRDYTGTERGSTYGMLHDCSMPLETAVPKRTKVRNLYLSGQSVYVHGILGVMAGGIDTAQTVVAELGRK